MKHGDQRAPPRFATREGQREAPGGFANKRLFCTSDGECVRAEFDASGSQSLRLCCDGAACLPRKPSSLVAYPCKRAIPCEPLAEVSTQSYKYYYSDSQYCPALT